MATPLTADQMLAALTAEGITVAEHPGWRTHNRAGHGEWGPVHGVVIHHTAGTNSLELVYNGRSGLPGPLCHAHLAKDGTLTLVGNGRANHAGTFAANAVAAMIDESSDHPRPDSAEPVDANAITYGIEIENRGDGKDPYTAVQYAAAVRFAAAICRKHGWTADSVIGHDEGTRRKVDPSFGMGQFRKDVTTQLATKPAATAGKPATHALPVVDLSRIVQAAHSDPGARQGHQTYAAGVRLVEEALDKLGYLNSAYALDGSYGTATVAAYARWQRHLGYTGRDADGIPGRTSLTKLGKASRLFAVVA